MIDQAKVLAKQLADKIPSKVKNTAYTRFFGLTKIPLILFLWPTVEELSESTCKVRVPLNRRSKNHLGAMYFGALAIGADVAGGIAAIKCIADSKSKVSFVFKDMKGQFLKRAESDVLFTCTEVAFVKAKTMEAIETKERVNFPIHIVATTPAMTGDEPIAEFTLTMSLKAKS